jgi:site-specific DNA recombinase
MMPATTTKRGGLWALYLRESTAEQLAGKSYNSLESQEDFLRRYVAEQGGEVFEVYQDVRSGTKEREGLDRLVADGLAGRFQIAVAYDLDRWSRSVPLWMEKSSRLRQAGVEVRSATQTFDDSAEGELMELQMAGFAQYFSRLISRKVKIKRAAMAEKGMWPGGRAPFGYSLVEKQLTPVEHEAEAVRLMFSMFIEHPSRSAVRKRLTDLGFTNRAGKPWSSTAIEHLLRNPVYTGAIEQSGKRFTGTHPAIVEVAVFERAQAVEPTKRRLDHKNKVSRDYPLAGVLVCAECGSFMTSHYVQKPDRIFAYYRCTATFRLGWRACSTRQVNADVAEREVEGLITDLVAKPELVERAVSEANGASEAARGPLGQRARALAAQLKGLDMKAGNLMAAMEESGTSPLSIVQDRLKAIDAERIEIKARLAEATEQLRAVERKVIDLGRVRAALADVRLLYDVATPKERGELVRLLFKQLRLQKAGPLEAELFDRDSVVYRSSSIRQTVQLPELDSNRRPIGEQTSGPR